jgi:hypothetical protein
MKKAQHVKYPYCNEPNEVTWPMDTAAKFIQYMAWLPPLLLGLGIYMLIKKRGGLRVVGELSVLMGAVLMALQIWVYARYYRR